MPKNRRWNPHRWLWRGALGLLVLGALAAVAFYLLAVRPDRRSVPYRRALERLRANPSATRLLGGSVEAGWWVRGHVGADSARLTMPVAGARSEGVLHVAAEKGGGAWRFSRLELTVPDNSLRLSLLKEDRRRERGRRGDSLTVPPRYRK